MANKGILYIVLKEYTTDRGNLHPNEISNLEMGYILEEIIRRFSESHNEDAGQHYTPNVSLQDRIQQMRLISISLIVPVRMRFLPLRKGYWYISL